MARYNIAPEGEERPPTASAELLDTDARVLAYLRAAMLESGDDPNAMAVAMKIVDAARAQLQRKDPLRAIEPRQPTVKRSL